MENERPPARPLRPGDVEVLRDRWDEGKASGRAGPLDIKRIIAEERARLDSGTRHEAASAGSEKKMRNKCV